MIAQSSTEAEYYASAEAIKEALWFRQVLEEVGYPIEGATKIAQDNLSAIAVAANPVHHKMMKHVEVKESFIRDHLKKKHIELI